MATKSIRLSNGTDTLLPESAVSTENYTKCADGTLIVRGEVSKTLTTVASGGVYSASTTIDLPMPFVNTSYQMWASARAGTGYEVPCGCYANTASRAQCHVYDLVARTSASYKIRYVAIGRWK